MNTAQDQKCTLQLTPLQREAIRELTGREAEALTLTIEQLEERIAPRLAGN